MVNDIYDPLTEYETYFVTALSKRQLTLLLS